VPLTDPHRPETPPRTRFICTIGPRTASVEALADLHLAGMNIARVNGSHGSLDDVRRMISFLRKNAPEGVEVLLDLPGNKIRTDNLAQPVLLVEGQTFVLPPERVTWKPLYTRLQAGDRISAADGAIQLEVVEIRGEDIVTRVLVGGTLHNRKGLNIRGIHASIPFDFERDISLINVAIEERVDYIGLSFVRAPEQVRRIKSQLVGTRIRVVAKIETAEAVEQLPTILRDTDLIMIDRGDLEAEIGRENVPLTQKAVIRKAREAHVPVIVASQFLTSMLDKPVPFMAEVSDVANAVLDRADILMLSEETAVGSYPSECIGTMRRVAQTVERSLDHDYGAIILAAGPSYGFGSLTTNKHKCMLDVGGTTIVCHQLDNLRACGIRDEKVAVVTGHNHAQIEHYLRGEGFGGSFVYNPWFATTNMLVSLWLARPDQNVVVLYGDIIFDPGILADVLATPGEAVLAIDADSEMTPEDEKVIVKDGHLVAASKELDPRQCAGEFIGLARFSRGAARKLFAEMDRVVKSGNLMAFLTVALEQLAARGTPLIPCPTERRPWADNDGLADLDHSREKVYPAILARRKGAAPAHR
jgi:pyruvate kinase